MTKLLEMNDENFWGLFEEVVNEACSRMHTSYKSKGFWEDFELATQGGAAEAVLKAFRAQKIALIHSEFSEALEADRKDLKDDKLTEFFGFDVELGDGTIRTFDLAGAFGIKLGTLIRLKHEYNSGRPHKHGKAF